MIRYLFAAVAAVLVVTGQAGPAAAQYTKASVDDLKIIVDAAKTGNAVQKAAAEGKKSAAFSAFETADWTYTQNYAKLAATMDPYHWEILNDALWAAGDSGSTGDDLFAEGLGWRESAQVYYGLGDTAYGTMSWAAATGYYSEAGFDYLSSTYDYFHPCQTAYDDSLTASQVAAAVMAPYLP